MRHNLTNLATRNFAVIAVDYPQIRPRDSSSRREQESGFARDGPAMVRRR